MTRIEVLRKIRADLAWRGPGDKAAGHVVLTRAEAELLLNETEADAILQAISVLAARVRQLIEPIEEGTP